MNTTVEEKLANLSNIIYQMAAVRIVSSQQASRQKKMTPMACAHKMTHYYSMMIGDVRLEQDASNILETVSPYLTTQPFSRKEFDELVHWALKEEQWKQWCARITQVLSLRHENELMIARRVSRQGFFDPYETTQAIIDGDLTHLFEDTINRFRETTSGAGQFRRDLRDRVVQRLARAWIRQRPPLLTRPKDRPSIYVPTEDFHRLFEAEPERTTRPEFINENSV
jgi:hypothetical protein